MVRREGSTEEQKDDAVSLIALFEAFIAEIKDCRSLLARDLRSPSLS